MKRTAAFLLLVGLWLSQACAQSELTLWNTHPEGYPVTEGLENFAATVQSTTQNRVHIKISNNAVLGDQPTAIKKFQKGEIEMGEFNIGPLADAVPGANVLTRPFLFQSSKHMFQHVDGALGKRIEEKLYKAGFVVLGWYDGGSRSFFCTKPIQSIKDLKGLRIRVQASATAQNMVNLLGATPVVISSKDEVNEAFRVGKLDCAENNMPFYETAGHMKLAKYVYLSNHTVAPEALVMSVRSWEKLSTDDQKRVMEAGRQSAQYMRERWGQRVESSRQAALKQGSVFVAANDSSTVTTYRLLSPLLNEYLKKSEFQSEVFMVLTP
jgi:TRAP-type C4-dicarboxylate transport system substrate-binding protein